MTDERRERNMKKIGITPEKLEEHLEQEKMQAKALELFKAMNENGCSDPPDFSAEEQEDLEAQLDRVLDMTGSGFLAMISPEHTEIIKNLAGSRGQDLMEWMATAVQLLLGIEMVAIATENPGGRVIVDARPSENAFGIFMAPPDLPTPPNHTPATPPSDVPIH